jgi:putative membrane-bound dehydrogenase-like protein
LFEHLAETAVAFIYNQPPSYLAETEESAMLFASSVSCRTVIVGLILQLGVVALAAPPSPEKSPVTPEESLRYFQLPEDLTIELVAAEPEVVDPIEMRFDEYGRLYVVEMRDYPTGPVDGGPPLSRIKLLEDRDGDGRYETAHVFAENLQFATGVQPWKGGVIVTLAGRVAYMKDTNGDHRADVDETWFTGFAQENSQLRANHPRFGHDNHIYIANGLRGGKVVDARQPDSAPINISGRDFRFDPRSNFAEAITGVGQYGLCFDNFGNRFVCQNRNPLQHVVFEDRDLKKSKHFTPPAVVNDVAAFAEKSKLFPLTKTWTTSNLHENTFTAACGVNIYRGTALPTKYRGLGLTCDPTGNLVHAERMEAWGPTFKSKPIYEGKEFLASTDEWFRPVAIENGPDGALYVVDMYRAVIEHPDFVPEELKKRPDQRLGDDLGRIYRIVPKERAKAKIDLPRDASAQELVLLLAHENAWQRETAQRLLIERGEKGVESELVKLLNHNQPEVAVFHAMWTLQGLGLLTNERFGELLKNWRPGVADFAARAMVVLGTGDDFLRDQLFKREHKTTAWEVLARAPLTPKEAASLAPWFIHENMWSQYAFMLSIDKGAISAWWEAIKGINGPSSVPYKSDSQRAFSRSLARLAASTDDAETVSATLSALESESRFNVIMAEGLCGLAEGLKKQNKRLVDYATDDKAKAFLARAISIMLKELDNPESDKRLISAETLSLLDTPECRDALKKLTHDGDQTIRIAAIKAVLSWGEEKASRDLLDRARSESPTVKRAILEGLCGSSQGATMLLDAMEDGRLKLGDLDPTLVPRLVNSSDAKLRERAKKLLTPPVDPNRQKTIETYLAALNQTADPKRGRGVFEKNCAACHRVGDVGVTVAPDISDSRTKTPQQILLDVLEPNRAVDGNYVAYVIVTDEGKTLTGVIAAESSQAITLKQPGGEAVVVPRESIEEIVSTGRSFMPEGLDRTIPPNEMADLVSYIKNWRYLDGRVPASTVAK